MYITRELPNNEYQAAVNANSPTALNPFATISDLPGASNWQSVMSAGSAAIGITSSVLLDVEDNFITFDSNDTGTGNSASIILDGTSGSENTYIGLATGGGLQALNILPGSATYFDLTNSKGLVYAGDYSAAGILDDRWIPDYGAVKALIAGGSNGIYGGSDFLSVSTTVSLTDGAAADYDLTFATLTEAALVHYDAANNRVGFGTAAPGHPLHFASGNAYFQNGSVAIGTTVPDALHKFRVSTDNADGNNYTTARFDLGYDAATGSMQGVQIRSTTALSGTSSTLYGVNSNITGSASAGTHTVIAGRFRAAKTQGGTSTVTNYALQLEDGTEGTIGYVLAAATVNGHTNWVDVNTLVSGAGTLYTADSTVGSGRIATLTDSITFTGGQTILNFDDSFDTLILGNDSVGNKRAGLIFNSDYLVPSRIYDRSDGTHNKGLTLQSRDNVFEFISAVGSTAAAEIHAGVITKVRTISGEVTRRLDIQGATTPNDADDGVKIWTANASNVMVERFNIQADASDVKAYFDNITGLYVGGTGTPTSMLTVNGDVEALGSTEGFVTEDRLGGGNRCRIYAQEDTPGVFTLYTEPA